MPRSRKHKTQTLGSAHPTGLEQVPIVACNDCSAPLQSVAQMGAQLCTRPDHRALQIPLWFMPATKCKHCEAKPPFLTVNLTDLEDDLLIRERINVRGVHWAMHACMTAHATGYRRELSQTNDSSIMDLMRRMDGIVQEKYEGAKGKNANAVLVAKLDAVLKKVNALLDRVPTKARINIECINGTYTTSLYVLSAVVGGFPAPAALVPAND